MAEAPPPTTTPRAPAADPSSLSAAAAADPSSSSAAAPRSLPPTLLLSPCSSRSRWPARGGGGSARSRGAARSRKGEAIIGSAGGAEGGRRRHDRLVEAVRVVGGDVGAGSGVAGADILELAMAKGPMFSWLSYWPEEGYPQESHPY